METLEQKKRRLFGKQYMSRYLSELSRLLKKEIKEQDLLSVVDSDNFINSVSYFKSQEPHYKATIKFSNKNKLKKILTKEISNWDASYMMFLSDSFDCGLLKIPNFNCFNLDFSFNDEHAGIIIFTRVDGKEKIIFDYYEEGKDQCIDIDIFRI